MKKSRARSFAFNVIVLFLMLSVADFGMTFLLKFLGVSGTTAAYYIRNLWHDLILLSSFAVLLVLRSKETEDVGIKEEITIEEITSVKPE